MAAEENFAEKQYITEERNITEDLNVTEEQNIKEEQNVPEEQNIAQERNITENPNITEEKKEELTAQNSHSTRKPNPPDHPRMKSQNNGKGKSTRREQNWPMHERCVHGEINEICIPLDRSEVYFRLTQPYALQPLSRYFFREWSEGAHLFKPPVELMTPFGYPFPKGG